MPGYVWDGETLPVPVEEIVDSVYGLLVREVDDMSAAPGAPPTGGSISGLLYTDTGEIWVNRQEGEKWPGRRRFTIGHELGHWVMHDTGSKSIFCRSVTIESDPEPDSSPVTSTPLPPVHEVDPIETEADAFAAAMLMPEHLVKAHYELCDGEVERLMEGFKCSQKAMLRRVLHVVPSERRREFVQSRRR